MICYSKLSLTQLTTGHLGFRKDTRRGSHAACPNSRHWTS